MYTSIIVKAWPRKTKLTNKAIIWAQKVKENALKYVVIENWKELRCFAGVNLS